MISPTFNRQASLSWLRTHTISWRTMNRLAVLILLSWATPMHAHDFSNGAKPLVIAHRGASGYLPEHSEAAKVLAYAQGADIIEQDVVLSRDGVLVISHDITMEHTTNIRDIFPDRIRPDGHFYFADFDWAEIRSLSLHERRLLEEKTESRRFPFRTDMHVVRLEDEIKLILGMNQTLKHHVGFHIELKKPSRHQQQFGYRMGKKLIEVLQRAEMQEHSKHCFIQCFEPDELRFLRQQESSEFPLVQLLGTKPLGLADGTSELDELSALKAELPEIAKYADGIGPSIDSLVSPGQSPDYAVPPSSGLVEAAHELQLFVHPYTVRADDLPSWCPDLEQLHNILLRKLKVDGIFTDFPDLTRKAVDLL